MTLLSALFQDSAQGRGLVVVIRGPAASGKTTLLRALGEQVAASGALFLDAVASRAERGLPLGIVDQLFRGADLSAAVAGRAAGLIETRTLSGMREMPSPETVSPDLARAFEGLLKLLIELSEGSPVVLAVDDLQHTDLASLQFLSYLARRASTSRILMVLTESTQALPVDRLVRAEILRQGNCHTISLTQLSPAGVATLLSEHFDSGTAELLAPACHAMTGGNPLLVNALAEDSRAQASESPDTLVPRSAFRSAVVTCLHSYEPTLVELAQAVAVLGDSATPSLVGELLEASPGSASSGIDALAASGLLESGRFRHEAARQALLEHMTADERAAMHARAARMLYRTGAGSEVLAGHLVAAQRIGDGWTVPVLQDAVERALADGETDRAIGYLRRAEAEVADDRQRASIRFARARAEWRMDPERAARHMSELVADARAGLLDGDCVAELAYCLLWAGYTGNAEEALAALDRTAPDRTAPDRAALDRVGGSRAPHPAIRSALVFLCPDLAGRAALRGDNEGTLLSAEAIMTERGENDHALASVTTALMALICEDMPDRAAFWCNVLRNESQGGGRGPLPDALLTGFLAMIETRRGNLPSAQKHARTAFSLLTRKGWGVAVGIPLSSLMTAAIASRRYEDAAAYLRVPVPEAMFATPYGLLYQHARGEYYLATGRAQAALADFEACGDRMRRWGLDRPGLVPWRSKAAEAHLIMGNRGAARELCQEQLTGAGSASGRIRGISLRTLALTIRPSERIPLLRESADVLRDSGARLELAYTFLDLSNAHLAIGEHGRAHRAARQARDLMERCGAQLNTDTGTALYQREREEAADERPPTQLSNAERRVAKLAAHGYTNGQIAKKLYITVSTVEQHLTRVYRKLGVSGRVELPIEI